MLQRQTHDSAGKAKHEWRTLPTAFWLSLDFSRTCIGALGSLPQPSLIYHQASFMSRRQSLMPLLSLSTCPSLAFFRIHDHFFLPRRKMAHKHHRHHHRHLYIHDPFSSSLSLSVCLFRPSYIYVSLSLSLHRFYSMTRLDDRDGWCSLAPPPCPHTPPLPFLPCCLLFEVFALHTVLV